MVGFRNTLKKRLVWLITLNCLVLVLLALTAFFRDKTAGAVSEFINGFQTGIFSVAQLSLLLIIIRYIRVLKNEEKLKKLYIEENDERAIWIRDKIGGFGFLFSVVMIATATVIAGFFNIIVFCTLFAVTFFMVIVKASLKIYYKSKY